MVSTRIQASTLPIVLLLNLISNPRSSLQQTRSAIYPSLSTSVVAKSSEHASILVKLVTELLDDSFVFWPGNSKLFEKCLPNLVNLILGTVSDYPSDVHSKPMKLFKVYRNGTLTKL